MDSIFILVDTNSYKSFLSLGMGYIKLVEIITNWIVRNKDA